MNCVQDVRLTHVESFSEQTDLWCVMTLLFDVLHNNSILKNEELSINKR